MGLPVLAVFAEIVKCGISMLQILLQLYIKTKLIKFVFSATMYIPCGSLHFHVLKAVKLFVYLSCHRACKFAAKTFFAFLSWHVIFIWISLAREAIKPTAKFPSARENFKSVLKFKFLLNFKVDLNNLFFFNFFGWLTIVL